MAEGYVRAGTGMALMLGYLAERPWGREATRVTTWRGLMRRGLAEVRGHRRVLTPRGERAAARLDKKMAADRG
jgi:DNA topoisomerase IA